MARGPVLPEHVGSFHDEDGAPLDASMLRAAAERVAAHRLQYDVGTLSCGLDTALSMGGALGRFSSCVAPTAFDDPPAEAIDAVVELAVFALWMSACSRSLTRAESEFEHALRLTESLVHAGRSEFWDEPGEASWCEWLGLLIGGASNVIDAACMCDFRPDTGMAAVAHESRCTPSEALELEARALLTSCLQTLVLFAAPSQAL